MLRFHDGAVNAAAILKDGRNATAGEDGRIAIWKAGEHAPVAVLEGHTAPIVALAVSPDGATLASASWDRSLRLWPLAGGAPRADGHQQNVNGVAFAPSVVISAGYDATVRIWPLSDAPPVITTLPTPLNSVAVAPDGEIIAGGADGKVYFLSPSGELRGELAAGSTPLIAVAVSADGGLVAAGIRGSVAVIEQGERKLARTLVGPGLPVWSAAFLSDNRTLITGGTDRMVRRWDAVSGDHLGSVALGTPEDPLANFAGDPGAGCRACVACHTRPTKAIAPARRWPAFSAAGSHAAGYNFSEPLKKLDIVWTPETVARLFGPAAYTPGTKMPEQTIGSAEERAALVKFLERATKRN